MKLRILYTTGVIACTLLNGAALAQQTDSGPALYHGFTLLDPDARTETQDAYLLVRDGLIEAVGQGEPPAGAYSETHDMTGLFGMAGLIDAHGHITGGPQRVDVVDGVPQLSLVTGDEYSRVNAAAALAFGVTTLRNPGGSTQAAARYDAMEASGEWVGPEAIHAGEVHQPPPYSGESFAYPKTPDEWDEDAAYQAAAGMTYYKLYTALTEDEVAAGVAAAKAHGLIPIAHLNDVSWTRAAELGVQQLEHALPTSPDLLEPEARAQFVFGPDYMTRWWELADLDGPLIQDMAATLAERGVAVNLTLIVNEIIYFADELETRFPELAGDIPDYIHPDVAASLAPNYEAMAAVPPEQLARSKAVWPKVLAFAKLLHDAGVPLMIGTDGTGGGASYFHELENHVLAGFPEWQVLQLATSGNAALMGVGDRTGRIAKGMEADLVFLRADPTADIANVSQVEWVVDDGVAHRSEDLLDIARGIAAQARARGEAENPDG